jgi:hypothetical protein
MGNHLSWGLWKVGAAASHCPIKQAVDKFNQNLSFSKFNQCYRQKYKNPILIEGVYAPAIEKNILKY